MMERAFARLQLDGNGMRELLPLRRSEDLANRIHVSRQARNRQKLPAVAAGDIVNAAVFARAFVQADPAGEMGHGLGAGPIGIVLMPGHDAAVLRGLTEKLVVPEADRAAQKL